MRLNEILDLVAKSGVEDWATVPVCLQAGWTSPGGNLEGVMHDYLAVHRGDIDVSLAWGAEQQGGRPFSEPWTERFISEDAKLESAELRYRGQPVHRWLLVSVDGGRNVLPLPKRETVLVDDTIWTVTQDDLHLGFLLADLRGEGGEQYLDAVKRAGLQVRG